jgi:transposase
MVRLSCGLRAVHDDLQPFQSLVTAGLLDEVARCLGRGGAVTKSTAIDSTYIKPSARRLAERGRQTQAIGRSRGGWTTKVHALTDVLGRPYVPMLTAGNVSDVKAAPALLERAGRMRYLLGDKGYDANSLRKTLRENGTSPVIPGRRNRKHTIPLRSAALPRAPPHRERLLSHEGLPPDRHSLRQARRQLPVRRGAGHCRRILVMTE